MTADYLDCLKALARTSTRGIDHLPEGDRLHRRDRVDDHRGPDRRKGSPTLGRRRLFRRDQGQADYGKLSHRDPEELQAGSPDRADGPEEPPRRLRPLEKLQAGRALVGEPLGRGPARLAYRVLRHEHEAPRRAPSTSTAAASTWSSRTTRTRSSSRSHSRGKPFATYWLHNGLLTKGGRKISKSDPDTIVLMGDLLKTPTTPTPCATLLLVEPLSPPDRLRAGAAGRDSPRGLAGVLQSVRPSSSG